MAHTREKIKTFAGLRRAFRTWATGLGTTVAPEVSGATSAELHFLGALGGLAAEIGRGQLDRWPAVCRAWALAAPTPPAALVEEVGLELGAGEDVLAALYNACISSRSRRRLGTVFTPKPVVDHMIELVDRGLAGERAIIIDPGAGVGAFSIAAARRWPQSTTVAVDINPVTLGLLATRIAFEIDADPERAEIYKRIDLRFGNYLDLFREIYTECKGPIAALGNPPYTRVQQLPLGERCRAIDLAGGIIDNGHANLATLIQAMTLRHMRPDDVSCMLLPGSFSYTRASLGLRREMWRSSRPIAVEQWPAAERLFTGHSVQAAIISIGPAQANPGPLQLASVELAETEVRATASWSLSREEPEPRSWFAAESEDPVADSVPLASLAKVRRGIATGANHMFFLDDETAARLPDSVCVEGIQSLRGFDGDCLDREAHRRLNGSRGRRWLLAIPPATELSGELKSYVQGFEGSVKDRFLPSKRPLWYSLSLSAPPPILISPLSKGEFRVVTNAIGAIPSNNLFGIYPAQESDVERISNWLRSTDGQRELRRVSRRYPGGSYKLEPRDLGSAGIPKEL
jgi:adenine-specific DNA-methyltransferase